MVDLPERILRSPHAVQGAEGEVDDLGQALEVVLGESQADALLEHLVPVVTSLGVV